MRITREHIGGDRYQFDFNLCSPTWGYAQIDTSQDAWYFGTWANPELLIVVAFTEGDLTVSQAANAAEFAAEIKSIRDWDPDGFQGIDAMCVDEIAEQFRAMGLGDYLH